MPDGIKKETTPSARKSGNSPEEPHSEISLQMILQKVIGKDAYAPTPEQVSTMISQKGEINSYIY